jgi:hypothetical protein
MLFNRNYIIIIALIGILLLYSYYYYATNDKRVLELWGRIKGNYLKIYYISMFVSAFGFLLFFYYLFISNSFTINEQYNIFCALLGIVVISILWMPLSLLYLRNKNNVLMISIILVLLLVALFTLYLLFLLYNINEKNYKLNKKLALYGMIYFFIHAFFFDFISWSINFF